MSSIFGPIQTNVSPHNSDSKMRGTFLLSTCVQRRHVINKAVRKSRSRVFTPKREPFRRQPSLALSYILYCSYVTPPQTNRGTASSQQTLQNSSGWATHVWLFVFRTIQLFAHAQSCSVSSQVSGSELASTRARLSQLECWSDIISDIMAKPRLFSEYKLEGLSFSRWH